MENSSSEDEHSLPVLVSVIQRVDSGHITGPLIKTYGVKMYLGVEYKITLKWIM
jgi:hypothetical protein